jgi:hypothetical protein
VWISIQDPYSIVCYTRSVLVGYLKEESVLKRVTLYLVAELRSVSESNYSTEALPATSGRLRSLNT